MVARKSIRGLGRGDLLSPRALATESGRELGTRTDDRVSSHCDICVQCADRAEPVGRYNIRVLNLSLESTVAESYRTDPLDAAVEAAWFKGIVVVAAAANRGTGTDAVRYAPGNDPYVITVGAVDDQGTKSVTDDRLAPRSSRGTTHDGIAKPELVAPGAKIVSTLAPASAFTALCPTCAVDGEYIRAGGTSMPCPTRDAARRVKTCSALSAKRGRRR
jgi:hypothetical protein